MPAVATTTSYSIISPRFFSVIIAGAIFVIAWNTRQYLSNNFLLFLGIAYLFVGGLDLLHTFSYKGIAIFEGYSANLATQLWIAARAIESLSILAAFLFIERKFRVRSVFLLYTGVSSFCLCPSFTGEYFRSVLWKAWVLRR